MRALCLLAFGCLVGLLLYTYNLKYKTRQLEAQAQALANDLMDETDYVALMRAETGKLSNPGRIEELARRRLKLEPMTPAQTVPWSTVAGAAPQSEPAPSRKDAIAALIEKTSAPAAEQPPMR